MVRLSGPGAIDLAATLFKPKGRQMSDNLTLREIPHGERLFGTISDPSSGLPVDEVVIVPLRASRTFTGEDMVEITGHGGILVTQKVLQACLHAGARVAEPGEFSQRAFLNGKIDLTQAEAIMDLISARTELAMRAAQEQLEGRLGQEICALREQLIELIAHLEAYIDFPEEGIDPDTGTAMDERMERITGHIGQLLATADEGRILREGVRTVIAGEPNAGKSSLLNCLLGFERAIVSHSAGTTRDVIEESINIKGVPFNLIDTAGLRDDSRDEIELEGMRRTREQIQRADVILLVADLTRRRPEWIAEIQSEHPSRTVLVLNKDDLPAHEDWRSDEENVRVSCLRNTGISELGEKLFQQATGGKLQIHDSAVTVNTRHRQHLEKALSALKQAREAFDKGEGLSPEFVAVDLREAMDHVGDIAGRVDAEEILGAIFSRFCIGK